MNEQDNVLYYGKGNSGGVATSIIPVAGPGAFLQLSGGGMSGGINFGAAVASGVADLSKHLSLHSNGYGFSITSGQMNYAAAVGGRHVFVVNAVTSVTVNNAGITMAPGMAITLAADPTAALHAATKQYVDAQIIAAIGSTQWDVGMMTSAETEQAPPPNPLDDIRAMLADLLARVAALESK